MKEIVIHTDGACEGNPGTGGWAGVLDYHGRRKELSNGVPATTNNRMELQAAIAALQALKEPCAVELFTDSEYLRQGITEWLPGWKARGWRTADKKPVKNADLWRAIEEAASRHRIQWQWVKGHKGHPDNERCDWLAKEAIRQVRRACTSDQLRAHHAAFQQHGTNVTQGELL